MTFAWGENTSLSHRCQGIKSHYHSANAEDEMLRLDEELVHRQLQEQYRRGAKKERKQKNSSFTSLPAMPASSLRSILKPSTSVESLVRSNYMDKRGRIEDIYGTVPPGVRAYWMRDRQLRKSLKRGKKVQFHESSDHVNRGVAFSGRNSKHCQSETFSGRNSKHCQSEAFSGRNSKHCQSEAFSGRNSKHCQNEAFSGRNSKHCQSEAFSGRNSKHCQSEAFSGRNSKHCQSEAFSGRNSKHCQSETFSGRNSKHCQSETFYDDYEGDVSDERVGPMVLKSDEESYCKKRVSTPVASRRSKPKTGSENNGTGKIKLKDEPYDLASSIIPDMGSTQDPYEGSSSSNYSYCPNEMAAHLDCPQMVSSPLEAERCMFVRSCVKVAGDPNEDIITYNAIRRQSINRINAFMRSSGRYSQRGYHAYSSAMNRRINVPTRRNVRGNPNFEDGRDFMGGPNNHIHVPLATVYPNDFTRSSFRMSNRGVPINCPASGEDTSYQDSFSRAYEGFERPYGRGSRRSKQSGSVNKQDGTMIRGSSRRQSHRRRPGLDNVVFPEARASTRRSRQRREDRGLSGCHRQSTKEYARNPPEALPEALPETEVQPPVNHLSVNQPDCPSSSSSSPYFVRPAVHVNNPIQEETKVSQEQHLPPVTSPAPTAQDNKINHNGCQEDNFETCYETPTNQPEVDTPTAPGAGGVPTVGGEFNMQRHVMLPLAEAVVAGALRRSARQKRRGVAYYTFRKGKGEAVSDLEVITEDQPGRHSPACTECTECTEGHWSAPESRTVATRPAVPPKPPPRTDKVLAQQNAVTPVPVLTGKMSYEEPVRVKPVPVSPLLPARPPKTPSTFVDNEPISMLNAAQQLENQFANIARRSPPVMSPPDSAPIPASQVTKKDNSKGKESKLKENKSKKPHKKKKKKEDEEKKTKKKEEKEKKEKKKEKKKKKKKDKVKTKKSSSGDVDGVDKNKSTPEGARQPANANAKKVPLKPPRKRAPGVASEDRQPGLDAKCDVDEQGHLTFIQVVNSGAEADEKDDVAEEGRFKSESGFTRLSRKISHRVGTWGKDFKRLLSFRREKPPEDTSSVAEDENTDINDVAEHMEEAEHPLSTPAVGPNQINISGAYLPTQPHPKVPLLPPKCTPVAVPVPPPNVSSNKTDQDCLNFCDEGKTNQIIYWLQNVYSTQNVEEHLAMLTATTLATQF